MTKKKNTEKTVDIHSLIQDDHNFNKGTAEGKRLMDKSFQELGAGRSILIDKNNRIIAGNKSQQAAIDAGILKVKVIETTGDELVAVKRTDIDIDSEKGRKLALADNATTAVNLDWNDTEIEEMSDEYGIDTNEWSVKLKDIENPLEETKTENSSDTGIKELKLVFTPEQYQFVLKALRKYGNDFTKSFLQILNIA